ncbi:hypothetical protein DV736_g6547, partial [Chaetothyriales sp. CBS 134916]
MAPLPPKSTKSNKSSIKSAPLFASNKKDKRRIKHAQLLSKITKSHTKKAKRRRASKKLVTTLDALASALPNDDGGNDEEQRNAHAQAITIIKRKSLKSRPGALKRRQRVDNEEMARFARNMAQLATSADPVANAKTAPTPTQKWAALRHFISHTLEKKVPAS